MDKSSSDVTITAIFWLVMALIAGATGMLTSLKPPFPQLLLFGLVVVLILHYWLDKEFRNWCLRVDIKVFMVFNLVRFVGIYFLILYTQGKLPYEFAVPGGWGDIVIAALSALLIMFVSTNGKTVWFLYFIWNLIGLLDILFVVATAAMLAMVEPESMSEILKLPLSLLPTFIVPIIIFIHLIIFIRLYRSIKSGYAEI